MAYNEKLTARIREALAHAPNVEEKRMFRGVAFMVNDKMCIAAGDTKIMCRIDPSSHEEALKKKGCVAVKMRGREYKGWVYVNEENIKTKERWIIGSNLRWRLTSWPDRPKKRKNDFLKCNKQNH